MRDMFVHACGVFLSILVVCACARVHVRGCLSQEVELHFYRKLQAARKDGGLPVEVSALQMEKWMEACALPVASTDTVLPEDRLEGNRRRDFLGQGGFGTVYKGKFFCPVEREDVLVAVKKTSTFLTLPEAEAQEQQRSLHDCLRREVRVLSGLQHANVIKLYAFSEPKSAPVEGGFPRMYLAYELCSGGTLADSLRSDDLAAQLSWDKRLALVLGVAQALVYLHNPAHGRATIFHRDVKPQNIALGAGEWPAPKLIDCGLARYIPSHDSKLSHHSKTGQVFGTPGYQCPTTSAIRPSLTPPRRCSLSESFWLRSSLAACRTNRSTARKPSSGLQP